VTERIYESCIGKTISGVHEANKQKLKINNKKLDFFFDFANVLYWLPGTELSQGRGRLRQER